MYQHQLRWTPRNPPKKFKSVFTGRENKGLSGLKIGRGQNFEQQTLSASFVFVRCKLLKPRKLSLLIYFCEVLLFFQGVRSGFDGMTRMLLYGILLSFIETHHLLTKFLRVRERMIPDWCFMIIGKASGRWKLINAWKTCAHEIWERKNKGRKYGGQNI